MNNIDYQTVIVAVMPTVIMEWSCVQTVCGITMLAGCKTLNVTINVFNLPISILLFLLAIYAPCVIVKFRWINQVTPITLRIAQRYPSVGHLNLYNNFWIVSQLLCNSFQRQSVTQLPPAIAGSNLGVIALPMSCEWIIICWSLCKTCYKIIQPALLPCVQSHGW